MTLRNLRTIDDQHIDLHLGSSHANWDLSFDGALVMPGLVNSHDHLEFNLYPQLGDRQYRNYTEWGKHIHAHYKKEINKVAGIPLPLRAQWGLYKNLLCGVTTVIHHGRPLTIKEPHIRVCQHTQNLHSVQFEKLWKLKLNNPLKRNKKCVIHVGEGTDESSAKEIDELLKHNFMERELVGVHGVALKKKQSAQFSALVWCPLSNDFLLGKTADVEEWETTRLFGTDSTLTGSWDFWEHIRFARSQCRLTSKQLFQMVSRSAGKFWGLSGYHHEHEYPEDLVIVRPRDGQPMIDQFFETGPDDILLVIQGGKIRLFDQRMHQQLRKAGLDTKNWSRVNVHGEIKFVQGNLVQLMREIKKHHPEVQFPVSEAGLIAE